MADLALIPRFTLLRSYVKGVGFYAPPGSTIYAVDNLVTVDWPTVPYNISVAALIKPEFFNWSSNTYTPDWIYAEYYAYFRSAPGTHFTYLPFTSYAYRKAPYGNWYLTNHLDVWPDFYTYDLPAAPPTYWHQLPP